MLNEVWRKWNGNSQKLTVLKQLQRLHLKLRVKNLEIGLIGRNLWKSHTGPLLKAFIWWSLIRSTDRVWDCYLQITNSPFTCWICGLIVSTKRWELFIYLLPQSFWGPSDDGGRNVRVAWEPMNWLWEMLLCSQSLISHSGAFERIDKR